MSRERKRSSAATPAPAAVTPARNALSGAKQLVGRLRDDVDGMILPYVTIMLTVIVGVSVLALDGARYESLQTQLQKGADSLALTGAAELNRLPDSITRATAAICGSASSAGACSGVTASATLVSNSSFFGTGTAANVTVSSLCFLSSLPAGTTTSLGTCLTNTTNNAVSARFVQVVVSPVSISTVLPASFYGGATSVTGHASAVAGNDTTVCDTVPMFTCNPYEQSGDSYGTATQRLITGLSSSLSQRTLILLQGTQGNNGQYYPGNFGYLQPAVGSLPSGTCGPGSGVVQAMAMSSVNVCTNQNAVSSQTGNDQNVFEGLDVRFDLWKAKTGSFQHCSTDSNYAPDVNVRKGWTPGNGNGGACRPTENSGSSIAWPPGATGTYANNNNSTAVALPLDNNMYTAGAVPSTPTVFTGNGNWTCGDAQLATTAVTTQSATLTFASTNGITLGMAISGTNVPSGATVAGVSSTTVTMSAKSAKNKDIASGATITFAGYWSTAHAGDATALANPPTGCTAPATTSRYAVYQYEIANSYSADYAGGNSGGEQGSGAMCSTTTPVAGRRILHVAILNCLSLSIQGHATNVPVAAYAKMFLTVPVDFNYVNDPYVEITGLDTSGDGFQNQTVQLYR